MINFDQIRSLATLIIFAYVGLQFLKVLKGLFKRGD